MEITAIEKVGSVLLTIILALCFTIIADSAERIVKCNFIELRGFLQNGNSYRLYLDLEPFRVNKHGEVDVFWGHDQEYPDTVIRELYFEVNKRKQIIPDKSIYDLADILLPGGIYLTQVNSKPILYLEGGDGAGAYTAILTFNNNKLVERRIKYISSDGESKILTTLFPEK